jgi:hypothetical protein
MSYHPEASNDPNDVYAVIPMPAELRGPGPAFRDWWTVTRNGVPVRHYPPQARDLADRFATDPAYRQQLANKKKAHER